MRAISPNTPPAATRSRVVPFFLMAISPSSTAYMQSPASPCAKIVWPVANDRMSDSLRSNSKTAIDLLQNLGFVAFFRQPLLAIGGAVLGEEHVDRREGEVFIFDRQPHEASRVGVHRRFAKLHRIHFAEAFEALDVDLSFDAFRFDAREDAVALPVIECVVDILAYVDA